MGGIFGCRAGGFGCRAGVFGCRAGVFGSGAGGCFFSLPEPLGGRASHVFSSFQWNPYAGRIPGVRVAKSWERASHLVMPEEIALRFPGLHG